MKKIIVAGAGHGGISAAAALAQAGFDVTVIEKNRRISLGYDWHDCISKKLLTSAGFPDLDEKDYLPMPNQTYINPSKTVQVSVYKKSNANLALVDRKVLLNHIISFAEKQGVKFVFEAEVSGPICNNNGVTGISFKENEIKKELTCDLLIDSAGLFSPIRRSLPHRFNIQKEPDSNEVFTTWRGYFKKESDFESKNKYCIFFFHCRKSGMDWAIAEKDYVDILIGGFKGLTQEDINEALADFKKDYPLGELIRGGYGDKIPLGKFLPVFVCNGYTAVGNSAFMTEPLSGSGIDLSIKAGRLLAETVISSMGDFSADGLWKFNYLFFKKYAERYYSQIIIKDFLARLSAEDIDFLMEKNILGKNELGSKSDSKYTVNDILNKGRILTRKNAYPALISTVKKLVLIKKLKKTLPESYNQQDINKWIDIYKKF